MFDAVYPVSVARRAKHHLPLDFAGYCTELARSTPPLDLHVFMRYPRHTMKSADRSSSIAFLRA